MKSSPKTFCWQHFKLLNAQRLFYTTRCVSETTESAGGGIVSLAVEFYRSLSCKHKTKMGEGYMGDFLMVQRLISVSSMILGWTIRSSYGRML